jgi:signal peptide peptidase-like protein 2B
MTVSLTAMAVLITILFSFISSIALGALVYPYVDQWTNNRFSREVEVPVLGPIPVLVFVLCPFCVVVVVGWLLTKSWILNNVLAISLIIFFLTSVRLSSLKVASCLLILAFFYDIFWVFISSSVFGENVMVKVATGLDVPIKILVSLTL